jgi:hypothetical protein
MKRALQVVTTQQTGAPRVALENEAAGRLRSLGYTAGSSSRTAVTAADDPKRLVALNERFNTALTAFDEGRSQEALSAFVGILHERPDFVAARTSAATVLLDPAEITGGRPLHAGLKEQSDSRTAGQAQARFARRRPARPRIARARSPRRRRQPGPLERSPGSTRVWDEATKHAQSSDSCSTAIRRRRPPGSTWGCSNFSIDEGRRRSTRSGAPRASMRGMGKPGTRWARLSWTATCLVPSMRGGTRSACSLVNTICCSTWE